MTETVAPTVVRMHAGDRMVHRIGGVATVSEYHDLGPANQVTGRGQRPRFVASSLSSQRLPLSRWESSGAAQTLLGRVGERQVSAWHLTQASQLMSIGGPTFRG